MQMWQKEKLAVVILAALFLLVIVIPRLSFPDLDHGDEYADANILDAGKNFVKFGFLKCHFLPFYEPQLDKPVGPYTHSPLLSEIINGVLRVFFKTDSLHLFRGVALLCSFFCLLIWYVFILRVTNSPLISFLAALFYLCNPYFIFGADAVYQNAYTEFLRVLIFYVYFSLLVSPQRRKALFLLLWILVVIQTSFTVEYIIYLSLFFILFPLLLRRPEERLSRKYIFILLLAPVFGFSLRFLQNVWYFGSVSFPFTEFKNLAIERIAYSHDAPPLTLLGWWQNVVVRNLSLVFLFDFFLLCIAGFFAYLLYQKLAHDSQEKARRLLKLSVIFLICGMTWYIFFPSHSWAHAFVNFLARHLVPAAAIGFTLFSYIVFAFIKENNRHTLALNTIMLLIVASIAVTGVTQSELPVTPAKMSRAQEFLKFKRCLLRLNEISLPKDAVGVNYYRFPFMRYYVSRSFKALFDKASLTGQAALPRYFIFIPYEDEQAEKLLEFLRQRYAPLFTCKSSRFPSVFFELKR